MPKQTKGTRGRIKMVRTPGGWAAEMPFSSPNPSLGRDAYLIYQDCVERLAGLPAHQRDALLMNLLATYGKVV